MDNEFSNLDKKNGNGFSHDVASAQKGREESTIRQANNAQSRTTMSSQKDGYMQNLESKLQPLGEKLQPWGRKLQQQVQEHPYVALTTAVGVGFVLGGGLSTRTGRLALMALGPYAIRKAVQQWNPEGASGLIETIKKPFA